MSIEISNRAARALGLNDDLQREALGESRLKKISGRVAEGIRMYWIKMPVIIAVCFFGHAAYAQVGFEPRDADDGLNCLFFPMVSVTDSPLVSVMGGDNFAILKTSGMDPEKLLKAQRVFDFFNMQYSIADYRIFVPCSYYSDISFMLTVSAALLSDADNYPPGLPYEK